MDDAVSARKALNGREILGAEVGAVRIGFAKVPTKIVNAPYIDPSVAQNGIGSSSATYHALQQLHGASGIPVDRQIADGSVQDYRSNLVMGMVGNSAYASAGVLQSNGMPGEEGSQFETVTASINETQLLMRELSGDGPLTEIHVQAVAGEMTSRRSLWRALADLGPDRRASPSRLLLHVDPSLQHERSSALASLQQH